MIVDHSGWKKSSNIAIGLIWLNVWMEKNFLTALTLLNVMNKIIVTNFIKTDQTVKKIQK
jgi:hypothetical protein